MAEWKWGYCEEKNSYRMGELQTLRTDFASFTFYHVCCQEKTGYVSRLSRPPWRANLWLSCPKMELDSDPDHPGQ